ncbi:MAG: nicotinate (nicotinamide) nucleotide adenylyltransferase [Bacteroidota bacterium]|nr:nicotinate (nicotinamide) nucleotide adenylyltransferase [Bacteroidota bacterium]
MKTGLYFGSFNPIHIGHLVIASHIVDNTDLEEVWFVVSPQNPLKRKKDMLNEYERLELVNIAIEDDSRLRASDIEFHLPLPSYTIDTLLHLEEKYPSRKWTLIMGTDSVKTLPKWKNFEQLLINHKVLAYPRPGDDLTVLDSHKNIQLIQDVPLMQISATYIRNAIKNKRSIRYLVPDKVFAYIDKWGLYS